VICGSYVSVLLEYRALYSGNMISTVWRCGLSGSDRFYLRYTRTGQLAAIWVL